MNEYLTTGELAKELKSPESTVRYWRAQGIGPEYFRAGRRVLYPRAAVDRWIQEQTTAPVPAP